MRRFSTYLPFIISALVFVVPHFAHAAGILQPLMSSGGACNCTGGTNGSNIAPDWGCVLQTFQLVVNDFMVFATLIITIFIAYAGFTFILSPTNEEKRTEARNRILNAIIGLMIVLSAWLVVDSLMKVLYKSSANSGGVQFGPLNTILAANGAETCIQSHTPPPLPGINAASNFGTGGGLGIGSASNPNVPAGSGTPPPPGNGTGSCDASAVQQAAAAGGYNISFHDAQVFACLAKPESACGANTSGATTPGGQPTSAAGPWQNLLGGSDKCHSLNIPACGNLNCSAAYSGGKVKSDPASQQLAQQCQQALSNLTCSASAAACLNQAGGGSFGAWTADKRSSQQKACVSNAGG